jgi:hypothetical protein
VQWDDEPPLEAVHIKSKADDRGLRLARDTSTGGSMSAPNNWRSHTEAAVSEIQRAMEGVREDSANAWKEGLMLEAAQKLETALFLDEAQPPESED